MQARQIARRKRKELGQEPPRGYIPMGRYQRQFFGREFECELWTIFNGSTLGDGGFSPDQVLMSGNAAMLGG